MLGGLSAVNKKGIKFPMELSVSTINDEFFVGIIRNLSIFNSFDTPAITVDSDNVIVGCNNKYSDIFGLYFMLLLANSSGYLLLEESESYLKIHNGILKYNVVNNNELGDVIVRYVGNKLMHYVSVLENDLMKSYHSICALKDNNIFNDFPTKLSFNLEQNNNNLSILSQFQGKELLFNMDGNYDEKLFDFNSVTHFGCNMPKKNRLLCFYLKNHIIVLQWNTNCILVMKIMYFIT